MSYHNRSKLQQGGGFTLLEVLVALIILGLATVFLSTTISESLFRASKVDDDDRATTLADSLLDQLGLDVPVQPGITSGLAGNLVWRLLVEPYPNPTNPVQLDLVNLTILTKSNHLIGHWTTLRVAARATEQ